VIDFVSLFDKSAASMPPPLKAHFLPDLTSPEELAGGVVVVIDVLRASTTICHALAAGARAVIPCLEVEEARQLAAQFPPGEAVLGGERKGLRIEGFDLGNSPSEYTPATVGGKTVIFTTTNGTRAMTQCRGAARVLIGTFVNLSAVYWEISQARTCGEPVHLLCAGTRRQLTAEDVLFAGALARRWWLDADFQRKSLASHGPPWHPLNDQANLARQAWTNAAYGIAGSDAHVDVRELITPQTLAGHLLESTGGRNLEALGFVADIRAAAQIDLFDFVPELDVPNWRIVRA
jgi:2-phosphosulfolactate phosphatase